ncbi:MAG: branched-chain alpha-keto acid dehydrogenase subunit E2 [Candidatus Hydrogenedentes bacterium]|nr:branched-chain alpha-keto acid dehydrogenase subunit E2 [Candidatus Hydrogenedentota bacterium]
MIKEFKLPELGENVASGTLGKLLVKVGDVVAEGQNVLEIETDKAVAEIPSGVSGKITEIRVKEGAAIRPGEVVFLVETAAAPTAAAQAPEPAAAPAAVEAPKPAAPTAAPAQPAPPPAQPVAGAVPRPGLVRAAPSVRAKARELGVDLNEVPTADPSGRVTLQEVLAFARGGAAPAAAAPAAEEEAPAKPAPAAASAPAVSGGTTVEPFSAIRRKTAEHMTECWTTIPHVTHFDKADVTGLEELRKKYGKRVEAAGGRLTITSFVLKALPEVLKRFPKFNASLDMAGQQAVYKHFYNIGVAVDTPNGLLVPVIKDADRKSIVEMSVELGELAAKARERKLALENMQGGTFTVTNLGGLGGHAFTPIINAPETAILGMSRAVMEPVWAGGQFVPRLMLPFSLSYDHRLIDGADAARFLRRLIEVLEQPWVLFLEA